MFVQVLRLCAEAGLVRVGLLALDGTKLQADASSFQNYDADRLEKVIGELEEQVQQMLAEAARQDAARTPRSRTDPTRVGRRSCGIPRSGWRS